MEIWLILSGLLGLIKIGGITPIMNVLAIIAGDVLFLERWFSEGEKIVDYDVYVDAIAMEIEDLLSGFKNRKSFERRPAEKCLKPESTLKINYIS